jgi:Na+/H+ antiporter NhaD/arsenite permease-like protein
LLDNAPTYLIFFSLAGGDPLLLIGPLKKILLAISTGSVFMGALTYIGNAPNLLVKAIAEEEYRLTMPSFMGYILWALCVLVPLLAVWSWWVLL